MKPKGRRVASIVGIVSIATLLVTALLGRSRIIEEYWLRKLAKASSEEEEIKAIERLGEVRSTRMLPRLLDRIRSHPDGHRGRLRLIEAAARAASLVRSPAMTDLVRGITDPSQDVRLFSLYVIEELGPQAAEASSILIALVQDPNYAEIVPAIVCLGCIHAGSAVPVLLDIRDQPRNPTIIRDAASDALSEIGQAVKSAPCCIRGLAPRGFTQMEAPRN
jgi:HEAT repeat protein